MAITINDATTNYARVNYQTGDSLSGVINAVESVISARGWILHDALAGTNARAYKALNFSGTTYKYIVLDYNTSGYLLIKVYEDWDELLHTGTNICYFSDNTIYGQRIDLTNGADLEISVSANWLVITSVIVGQIGDDTHKAPTMCFEWARDFGAGYDDDTVGVPEWGWVNLGMVFSGDSIVRKIISPRDFEGLTGASVGYVSGYDTDLISGSYWGDNNRAYDANPNKITNKLDVTNVKFGLRYNKPRGRIFGLKIVSRNGCSKGDTVDVECDANYFCERGGLSVKHNCVITTYAYPIPVLFPQ